MPAILVVEDAPNMLRWLVDSIRRELPEAEVVGAATGTEAVSLAARHEPALVILDLALPSGLSSRPPDPRVGLSVLRALVVMAPRPRIVVISGLDLREQALLGGADGFIPKDSPRLWEEVKASALRGLSGLA